MVSTSGRPSTGPTSPRTRIAASHASASASSSWFAQTSKAGWNSTSQPRPAMAIMIALSDEGGLGRHRLLARVDQQVTTLIERPQRIGNWPPAGPSHGEHLHERHPRATLPAELLTERLENGPRSTRWSSQIPC